MNAPRRQSIRRLPGWRRDVLRGSLWFLPTLLVIVAFVLFAATYALDRAVYNGSFSVSSWASTGDTTAARTILTAIAASVITVVGVVFSITILALTLASTQFGPRILGSFTRDRGTQLTLGTFVATFVYCVLALGSVGNGARGDFVPHISVTVALGFALVDLGVLIYFIHHIAVTIQLPRVVHGIAQDLTGAIDALEAETRTNHRLSDAYEDVVTHEVRTRLAREGVELPTPTSGYLQAIGHGELVEIAVASDAIIEVLYRPGHFVVRGRPLAVVWPAESAPAVARSLARSHVTGAQRTLRQDLQFAIDQLVEIALRALSPAVNDTFTALTCIDWLGDGLCKISATNLPSGVYRDEAGQVRLLEVALAYDRLLDRSFDKIRQAGRGMPAVGIRQLENLAKIVEYTTNEQQRHAIAAQAEMVLRTAEAVPEPADRADLERSYTVVATALDRASQRRARQHRSPSRWIR